MLLGFGTYYLGRADLRCRVGVCSHCYQYSQLSSYNTNAIAAAFFIPVLPTGARRVVDHCSRCGHRIVLWPIAWRRKRHQDLDSTSRALAADPGDRELATAFLEAVVTFGEDQSFTALARSLEDHFQADQDLLVAIAEAYAAVDRLQDEERVLRAALALDGVPELRTALAVCLIRQSRLEEAQAYLDPEVQEPVDVLLLVEAFQAEGHRQTALTLSEELSKCHPEIELEPSNVNHLQTSHVLVRPGHRLATGLYSWVVSLLLVGGYLGVAVHAGRRREVYLVNGLDHPYTLRIGARSVRLPAASESMVRLDEGELRLRIQGAPIAAQTVSLRTPLLTRPWHAPTFVVNPDRTAILFTEQTLYATKLAGNPSYRPRFRFTAGKLLYRFHGIDFAFKRFPHHVTLIGEGPLPPLSSTMTRLEQLPPRYIPRLLGRLDRQLGPSRVVRILERRVTLDPTETSLLPTLSRRLSKPAYLKLLQTHLADNPPRVTWHMAYQDAMGGVGLKGRYRKLLAADPSDGARLFLLARVTAEPAQARRLYLRAIRAADPSRRAFVALARQDMAAARFTEGLRLARRGLMVFPGNQRLSFIQESAMLATGQVKAVLALNRKRLEQDPDDLGLVDRKVALLVRLGRRRQATQAIHDYCSGPGSRLKPADRKAVRAYLETTAAYREGDVKTFLKLVGKRPGTAFARALVSRDLKRAEALAASQVDPEQARLELYLACWLAGRRHLAAAEKAQLGAVLKNAGKDYAARPGPLAQATLLVAAAVAQPSERPASCRLARALCYRRGFPYLLLNRALERLGY